MIFNDTKIKIFFLSFLTISLFFNCACSTEKQNSIVYIFYDISEGLSEETKSEYKGDIEKIYQEMDVQHKGKTGSGYGEVCFSFLNHEYFDKPFYFSLEKKPRGQNPLILGERIKKFKNEIKDTLTKCLNRPITNLDMSSSIIFRHIIEGIRELMKAPYKKKIMIIYSDMVEHNPNEGLSFITGDLNENNFDKIVNEIERIYQINIPDQAELDDISIYVIRPDHEKYRSQRLIVEKLWKYILGSCCQFQPKLKFYIEENSN